MEPADTILIEMGDVLVTTFETSAPAPPLPVWDTTPAAAETPSHSPSRCWNCDRVGHDAWQCLTGNSPLHGACCEFGRPDHTARNCPIPSSLVTGILSESYVGNIHNIPRGYLNIQKDWYGGRKCKPDSKCVPRS